MLTLAMFVGSLSLAGCTPSVLPPSPTAAPVSTAPIVFATISPVAVQTPFAPPTAPPTATARAIPTPIPVPTVQRFLYVAGTGADGLTLRKTPAPDGERVALLPDGSPLTPTGPEEQTDGRRWRQVRDNQGREGWVAAEFLSPTSPVSSGTTLSPEIPTMIPTRAITLPPPPPTPTRAPTRTPQSSAPVQPPAPGAPSAPSGPSSATPGAAPKPQAPAVIVPTVNRFSPPAPTPTPKG